MKRLKELLGRYPELKVCRESIDKAFAALCKTYTAGGKLLICGNGGSAADADHMAAELLKGFKRKRTLDVQSRKRLGPSLARKLQGALPAIPLPSLVGLNTAFGNDCDPQYTFAQLVWGLGQAGDTVLCLSTSGNSVNVCHAARVAKAKGVQTLGLTGRSGGKLKGLVEVCICVPEDEVYKIQERHLPIYHILCLMLEDKFFG